MQGPFPFHMGGSESVRPAEVGPSLGPVRGGGGPVLRSAATPRVPAEDQWMGGGRSTTVPKVLMEGGGSATMPHEPMGVGGPIAVSEVPTERGGSTTMPS